MIRRMACLDPGLATFGIAVLDMKIEQRTVVDVQCVGCDTFVSSLEDEHAEVIDFSTTLSRVRRSRELANWLGNWFNAMKPDMVAAEAMSFPRGAIPIAMISLAWGVICAQLEVDNLPLTSAFPSQWRTDLIGKPAARGGTKAQRERRTQEREDASHAIAVARVPSFVPLARFIKPGRQPHALDALGVGCWAIGTDFVRGAQ
jgi:Holliday junction resolvasome RuvABC endonuclease subunit